MSHQGQPRAGQGHETLLEKLVEQQIKSAEQQIRSESAIQALIHGQEQHAKEIEKLQEKQVDAGEVLKVMALKWAMIQWGAITIGGFIIVYILGHFFKYP